MLLKHYLGQDLSKTAIAARVRVSRRTIHYWLAGGQLERDLDAVRSGDYRPRPIHLDPYHAITGEWLEVYLEL